MQVIDLLLGYMGGVIGGLLFIAGRMLTSRDAQRRGIVYLLVSPHILALWPYYAVRMGAQIMLEQALWLSLYLYPPEEETPKAPAKQIPPPLADEDAPSSDEIAKGMTDGEAPKKKGDPCPDCGKHRLYNHVADRCYGCFRNIK